MRKLIVMLLLAVVMVGCNSITDKAEERAKELLTSLTIGTDLDFYMIHTAFENDSCSLLHINYSYKDLNGKEHKKRVEYGYVVFENSQREFMNDLSTDKSVYDFMNEGYDYINSTANKSKLDFNEWAADVMKKAAINEGRRIEQ